MENNTVDNIMLGDKTLKQWEEEMQAPPIPASVSYTEAEDLGLMSPDEQPQQENKLHNTLDALGVEHPDADKEYEKLGAWDTTKDVLASLGTEASHIFAPKDHELQYESRTKFGENIKYGYRYIAGTAGFMAGGWGAAGIKGLANLGRVGSFIQKAGKVVGGVDLIKTGANATKAAQIGARVGNAALGGAVAGALADFNLYRPEENEGHLADIFGDKLDGTILEFLQTQEDDTDIDAKLKNVVEGLVIGLGVGNLVEFGAKPLFKKIVKNFKALKDGKKGAETEAANNLIHLERFARTADLVEEVKKTRDEAIANNQDASQALIDRLHPEDNIEAQQMLKVLDEDGDIFVHSDGTWDREVRTWDEAHKVTPEEYRKQLAARDEASETYAGDTAIRHQDDAVRHTWTNRGWIGENEVLNKANANKIAKNYKDKWQIDNNVKIEFVDGLTIKGQAVEGNTTATKYQGKATKSQQNAIDKKKVQIKKLEDKITMAEGGNAEVSDPLDILKEELRIAKNELKELNKVAKGKNKIPDITIQIDTNAKNPYATLRAELEHARDIAKGEVPNQAERHFSRYEGMNEGEVASGYVYKKAQGKNEALNPSSQNVMNDGNVQDNIIKSQVEQNFDNWYNNKQSVAMVGDIVNHEAFTDEGYLDDVLDVEIKHSMDEGSLEGTNLAQDNILAGRTRFENGKPVIYTNTNLPKEIVEANIYHEIGHVRQFQQALEDLAKGDSTLYNQLKEYGQALKQNLLTEEDYLNHPLEVEANNTKEFLKGIKEQYEQTIRLRKTGDNSRRNRPIERGDGDSLSNPHSSADTGTQGYGNGASQETSVQGSNGQAEPVQLKLDFSQAVETKQTTEEITTGLLNGELTPTTKGDIKALVSKFEQMNPEITGFKFEDIANDAEGFVKKLEEYFDEDDIEGFVAAFAKGDIDTLEHAIRKQQAAVHIIGNIKNNIKNLGDNVSPDVKVATCKTIQHLGNYISEIKSGIGRGLNSQKLVNSTLEDYGASRLSSWTKEGIGVYVDTIINDINNIISLNFTRGQKLIQEVFKAGLEKEETRGLTQFIIQNDDIKKYFINSLEKLAKNKQPLTKEQLEKVLIDTMSVPEYNAMFKASQLAPDKKGFFKTIKDWMDGNGGFTSYYVHNLLSGVGSLVKNVTSGAMNTLYFPAKKIIAGLDPFISQEARTQLKNEGWHTYKCMVDSWNESWQYMKEAFINGNGNLTDIGENTLNMNEGQFRGFHEFKIYDRDYYLKNPHKIWEAIQNFHSIMTRAMGATDEFMSQLNYRAITRSKSLAKAEKIAIEAGKQGDEKWIQEEAARIFKEKFDQHGKPTDVEALNEARTILYQNNLDGTMYNYSTNKKDQMREQTFVMKAASGLQQIANDNTFVKLMFPFVKTGTNILQMSLDHNGLYMALSPANQKVLFSKTKEGALARSQCAFGMFSLAMGSMLALNGIITGSAPSDPKERKALFALGWRPYSFKFGDNYISYQGYEPLHGMLGFAADCANMYSTITNPEDEKRLEHFQAQVLPTLVNNFLDKAAFRTGLKQLDLIMNPRDTEEWSKAMAQTAKGFLPNVAMVTNAHSVGTHEVRQPQTFYERVVYRYFPENWTPMDYRRNVFGERQSITGLLITTVGSQEGTPEEEALEHLAQLGYSPSEIDDVIANTGLKLSQFKDSDTGRSAIDAMKEEMSTVTIQGMTLREAVRALVTSEEYQLLPDGVDLDTGTRWGASEDTKINAINSVFLMYKQRAKKNIIGNSDYFVDSQGRTIGEAKEDIQLKRLQDLNNLY